MKAEHAGSLLELATTKCSSVKYDVEIVEEYFARQVCSFWLNHDRIWLLPQLFAIANQSMSWVFLKISSFCTIDCTTILQLHEIPSLQSIYTLDAAISKVQVSLDEHFSKMAAETDPHKSSEVTKNLLPATLQLIDTYASFTR